MKKRGKKARGRFFENKKGKSRKAQGIFGMGFGMIFSIILIIFFVIVAFMVIRAFLETQKCAQIGFFVEDLQSEIKKTWNSQYGDLDYDKGKLPSKIRYVCFADFSKSISATGEIRDIGEELSVHEGKTANMFLYPQESTCNMVYHQIDHIDIDEITDSKNPYCIPVDNGKTNIHIELGFNERLVTIS